MSIISRLKKLEEKQSPEVLNVILAIYERGDPLPEPHIKGGVLVSYEHEDRETPE